VLGRTVLEEYVVEEDAGRWVKRFVEGPNAGGRYLIGFAAQSLDATKVEAEAHPPPKGFDNGLGRLSDLGVLKALEKLVADHRRALEGYEPGRVRGDVDKVLRALHELTAPIFARDKADQKAIFSNFLEAAAVTAISDDEADEVERHTMKAVAKMLCFVDLDDATIDRIVRGTSEAAKAEGIEARCEKIGMRLRKLGFGQLGVAVAALIAQVSHGVETRELAALQKIAGAAGLPDNELMQIVSKMDAMLSTVPLS
jgi:tellurite resistance protein